MKEPNNGRSTLDNYYREQNRDDFVLLFTKHYLYITIKH